MKLPTFAVVCIELMILAVILTLCDVRRELRGIAERLDRMEAAK